MDGCQLFGQHSWRVHEMNMANYIERELGGETADTVGGGFAPYQMAQAIELTIEIVSCTHILYLRLDTGRTATGKGIPAGLDNNNNEILYKIIFL